MTTKDKKLESSSSSSTADGHHAHEHTVPEPYRALTFMTKSGPIACGSACAIIILPLILAIVALPTIKLATTEGGDDPNDPRTLSWVLVGEVEAWGAEQAEKLLADEEEVGRQEEPGLFMLPVFFSEEGNVLTKEVIERIREFEDSLFDHKEYEDFCLRSGDECVPRYYAAQSVTNYFYSSTLDLIPSSGNNYGFFGDGGSKKMQDFDTVLELLVNLVEDEAAAERRYFGKGFGKDGSEESTVTRATYLFGLPLKGYKSSDDDRAGQEEKFAKWIQPLIDDFKNDKEVEMLYLGSGIVNNLFLNILYADAALASLSLIFICVYMIFHTKSVFIASMGLVHIVLSFPSALFVYTFIFQIELFFGLNFLAIYIILAIGADDVFVFMDAYNLSRAERSLRGLTFDVRLTWVYQRAAKAMLITSVTTSVAFVATATSPLPTVSAFGLFTSVMIIFNYLLVISYFPCIVTVYHYTFEHTTRTCGCCPCAGAGPVPLPSDEDENDGGESGGSDDGHMDVDAMEGLQRFFHTTYIDYISMPYVQIGAAVFFLILFVVTVVFAAQMSPATSAEQFLPKSHPIQRWVTVQDEEFISNSEDDQVQVSLLFGVDSLDREGVGRFQFEDQGKIVWNDDFDIADPDMQQHIYDTCRTAQTDDELVRLEQEQCPMIGFKNWIESSDSAAVRWVLEVADGGSPGNVSSMPPGDFPVAKSDFVMLLNLWYFSAGPPDAGFNEISSPFDAGWNSFKYRNNIGFYGGVQPLMPFVTAPGGAYPWKYADEAPLSAENITDLTDLVDIARGGGGVKVRYMSALFNTTLKAGFTPYSEIEPHYKRWSEFMEEANDEADKDKLKGATGIQASGEWVWSVTQRTYVTSAITGGAVSVALAFIILLISTGNILVTCLAIASICGVVSCLLGIMVMVGWELGTIESISATVLVGLAVDYVVHLANAYMESESKTRTSRVRDAATEMGITVMGGAITSVGASLILFATTIQFFFKFGFFMCLTCFFSIFWSLGFFMPIMAAIGPEGNFGQLLWRSDGWIWNPFRASGSDSGSGSSVSSEPSSSSSSSVVVTPPSEEGKAVTEEEDEGMEMAEQGGSGGSGSGSGSGAADEE